MKTFKALIFPLPGALIFCFVISGLLYQLNDSINVKTWFITVIKLFPLYGTALFIASFTVAILYSFLAHKPENIEVFTFFSYLSIFLSLSAGSTIYYYNYFHFFMILGDYAGTMIFVQSCLLITAALVPLLIIARYSRKSNSHLKRGHLVLAIVVLTVILSPFILALPSLSKSQEKYYPSILKGSSSTRKIIILCFDSATMDIILPMVSEGRLPHFDDMMKKGSWARLKNFRPTLEPSVWTSLATGLMPDQHGIKDYSKFKACKDCAEYSFVPKGILFRKLSLFGLFDSLEFSVTDRKAKAYWNILDDMGINSGTINWPYTSPAEEISGFFLSDNFTSNHKIRTARFFPETLAESIALPSEITTPFQEIIKKSRKVDVVRGERIQKASEEDYLCNAVGIKLYRNFSPQVMTVNFPGLKYMSRHFYRFFAPNKFGNVNAEKKELFGTVIENYYIYLDSLLESWIDIADNNTTVMVLSPYGIEPVGMMDRLSKHLLLEAPLSGSHQHAPDGILIIWGDGIKSDHYLESASILDITPTLLYMLDLPAAQNMSGKILTGLFKEQYGYDHPVSFIPSYENARIISSVKINSDGN